MRSYCFVLSIKTKNKTGESMPKGLLQESEPALGKSSDAIQTVLSYSWSIRLGVLTISVVFLGRLYL